MVYPAPTGISPNLAEALATTRPEPTTVARPFSYREAGDGVSAHQRLDIASASEYA